MIRYPHAKELSWVNVWISIFCIVAVVGWGVWGLVSEEYTRPGRLKDIERWEAIFSSAKELGDLLPYQGYFQMKLAEMMASSPKNSEAILFLAFVHRAIQQSNLSRELADFRYMLAVNKRQALLSSSGLLRLYLSMGNVLSFLKTSKQKGNLSDESVLTKSDWDVLRKVEKSKSVIEIEKKYEEMLDRAQSKGLKQALLLMKAYALFELEPESSRNAFRNAKKLSVNEYLDEAMSFLDPKYKVKEAVGDKEGKVKKLLKAGRLLKAKRWIESNPGSIPSADLEIAAWLGVQKNREHQYVSLFETYFQALLSEGEKSSDSVVQTLLTLADQNNSSGLGALLRYQAWGLCYFDMQNYSQATYLSEVLKVKDPLSPYSQREFTKRVFKSAGYLLDQNEVSLFTEIGLEDGMDNNWEGFRNGGRRIAKTWVHTGQVFVQNFGETGKAEQAQQVMAGEFASNQHDENPENQIKKEGVLEQKLYSYMVKFIPAGVRLFKEQIAISAERLKESVFSRFYSEEEFQSYVLDKMRPSLGDSVKSLLGQINEEGFQIIGKIDFKVTQVNMTGAGRIEVDPLDGQLILKMDHVKVGTALIPHWLLEKVEKSFASSARDGNSSRSGPIEILEMKYQAGGIAIKCRKKY